MKNYQLYESLIKQIDEAETIVPCRDTDAELWFIEKEVPGNTYKVAVQLCQTCPVMKQCGEYAIEAEEMHGIWGGLTVMQRRKMRAARQRNKLK